MKNLVFLLFVILSATATAQNTFTSGYVVTSEGDTLRGLIFEQSDFEMSRRIIFKTSEDAEVRKFTTKQLGGFGFDSGREFETRILISKRDRDEDTTFIFAKNVLRGEIDVFVGRRFQKEQPDLFLDNNSNTTPIQIYRSRLPEAIGLKEFLTLFYNAPDALKNPQPVRFREKELIKNIAAQNDTVNNFPVFVYREKIEQNWDLLVGMPVDYSKAAVHFRGAAYFNRTRIERNSNISLLHGIIYHHWEGKEINNSESLPQEEINKKWQLINIMPIGIKFHGNFGIFRPYGYIGAGAAVLRETNFIVGEEHLRWKFIPTLNSGIGVRTRIGKHYLITELTPTINNLFLNLGLSL